MALRERIRRCVIGLKLWCLSRDENFTRMDRFVICVTKCSEANVDCLLVSIAD